MTRCAWSTEDPDYVNYHDTEWGVPVHDEHTHFEFLILEGAQAGLSWLTILKRRAGYRELYKNFDPKKVANFSEDYLQDMLQNPKIIRNKLKVRSSVKNAQIFLQIQKEFGSFDTYIWQFVNGAPIQNSFAHIEDVPVTTSESDALSKDLKKRGMSFVGSTIIYAHMQAIGMVNDHTTDCFRHKEVAQIGV
jgi:DNA-3-methyladenine glycosylase I